MWEASRYRNGVENILPFAGFVSSAIASAAGATWWLSKQISEMAIKIAILETKVDTVISATFQARAALQPKKRAAKQGKP